MVITQTVGHELMHNAMLIDTLCACFDNLDNKTGACEQLGIQRQTLYNRLDKVTQIVGIAPTDKISWSMLLLGAKMAKSQHNHNHIFHFGAVSKGNLAKRQKTNGCGLTISSLWRKYFGR